MFTIIDHKSSYREDFIILKDEPYRQTEFERRNRVNFLGMSIYIVSPEDLLISKLIWVQQVQRGLQMEDIRALVELPGMDWVYISQWINTQKLNTFNLIK